MSTLNVPGLTELNELLRPGLSPAVLSQLDSCRYLASVPNTLDDKIPCMRLNRDNGTIPVAIIPGWGEHINSRLGLTYNLAGRGMDITLAGQNRAPIPWSMWRQRDCATIMQARNYLGIVEQEGLTDGADVITHSYGSLIYAMMVKLAMAQGKDYFKNSRVIMLAPAGFNENETMMGMAMRGIRSVHGERMKANQDLPEIAQYAFASSKRALAANPHRTVRESAIELVHLRVDYEELIKQVGKLIIVPYAEDIMFPYELLSPAIEKAVELGATCVMPISTRRADGRLRTYGGEGATHSDESFNPARVAGAIATLLDRTSPYKHVSELLAA